MAKKGNRPPTQPPAAWAFEPVQSKKLFRPVIAITTFIFGRKWYPGTGPVAGSG